MSDTVPEEPEVQQPVSPEASSGSEFQSADTTASPVDTSEFNSPDLKTFDPSSSKSKGLGRKLAILIFLLIVIIAGVLIGLKWHNKHATNGKKDIPYLTYGFVDSGGIIPSYPLESADTNDSVFVDSQIYEGLVIFKNETQIQPALATSWTNPNNTTWIFNLRHGVKFHSGRTMTASDVAYSLNYAVAHQNNDDAATELSLASTIKKISIINPYQIKIITVSPDAVLLDRLAGLFIIDPKMKLGNPNAGTGPYIVAKSSIKPNATAMNLLAFNDYWGGHVYTREVHIAEVASVQQLTKDTADGNFDLAGDFSAQQQAEIKAKVKYYQPIIEQDFGINYLQLNTEDLNSPLSNLSVRQAMAEALSSKAILKAGGLQGEEANQVIPPSIPGYDPSLKNRAYDPSKAKQLLATVPNSSKQLTLSFPEGDEPQVDEIARELQAVGFNIKLNDVADFNTFINQLVAGQGDLFYLGYDTETLDGLDMLNTVVLGTQNFNNPQITQLINQAGSTLNPQARIGYLQQAEQIVYKDIPTIPLYTETRTYTLTKPYEVQVSLPSILASVYFWQVYQR